MFRPFSLNINGCLKEYNRPQVMGIINVTPDSFYEGSRNINCRDVATRVERMLEDGVDFIDLGGYSSRPGGESVSIEEELNRVKIGLSAIRSVSRDIPVSVDTFRSEVARRSIVEWGADIINDISGGDLDTEMFDTISTLGVPYIMMHMRGCPENMQTFTDYNDVTSDVTLELSLKLQRLRLLGVSDVIIDPGFGFSKTLEQNYDLLRHLDVFTEAFDEPVLVGVSRKSMIYKALEISADEALNGTTVLNTISLVGGASFLRVHDVKEAVEAVKLYTKLNF
ncbi:MAG: dihydropteroate synthase [Duncaniella sp.]|nr:dihydropteroate synthase [Duncaniella sp.]MDE6328251.1 dihydropteroate synthase [Duncaniella sp.]